MKSETGEQWKAPLVCVALVVVDEEKNKVLMLQREKELFRGYCGFHGGKIDSSEYILESAQRSLKEETGLQCKMELKGLFSSKTYNQNELSYNHQLFVVKATHPQGTLLKQTRKGTNNWVKKENIGAQHIFPNTSLILKIALSKRFRWIEADRFQEDTLFKGIDVKKDVAL